MSAPNYPYITGIPARNHNPSVDQPNMLTNTNSIASYVSVDHVPFGISGSGWHEQVTFAQANVPGSAPSNPIGILFTKNDGSSNPQLNYLNSQNIANIISTNGCMFAFGGMIFQWGTGTWGASATTVAITFPQAFPNNLWNVQMLQIGTGFNNILNATGTVTPKASFNANRASGVLNSQSFYWFAIGN